MGSHISTSIGRRKELTKFLVLWRIRDAAQWPTNPTEYLKLMEMQWAAIDGLLKKKDISEFGWFLDGITGYAMGEGDGATVFRDVLMFSHFYDFEVSEIIPYEKGKETMRSVMKAQIEAMKK
jgi:hypothetical protein